MDPMEITAEEVVAELRNRFEKEFVICVQAIQINKLTEQLNPTIEEEMPEDDS